METWITTKRIERRIPGQQSTLSFPETLGTTQEIQLNGKIFNAESVSN